VLPVCTRKMHLSAEAGHYEEGNGMAMVPMKEILLNKKSAQRVYPVFATIIGQKARHEIWTAANVHGLGIWKEKGAARAGALMSCLSLAMRAESTMCYIGREGTSILAYRGMCCGSLGENILVEASGMGEGDGKVSYLCIARGWRSSQDSYITWTGS